MKEETCVLCDRIIEAHAIKTPNGCTGFVSMATARDMRLLPFEEQLKIACAHHLRLDPNTITMGKCTQETGNVNVLELEVKVKIISPHDQYVSFAFFNMPTEDSPAYEYFRQKVSAAAAP